MNMPTIRRPSTSLFHHALWLLQFVLIIGNAFAFQSLLMLQTIALDPSVATTLDGFLFGVASVMTDYPPLKRLVAVSSSSPSPTHNIKVPSFPSLQIPMITVEDVYDVYYYDYERQAVSNTISLSREEQELFDLILSVRNQYSPRTTIRVAGGWVRDKLLQIPSATTTSARDIDFVLDNISGREFCQWVQVHEHLQQQNLPFSTSSKPCSTSSSSSSNSNSPSQSPSNVPSDHLQTATLHVNGFDLDFGCFRLEKYSKDSRIPEDVRVASAVQDAWRRDLTINALFYNINTNQVEDWTEQGLQDLKLGQIATPLPPLPSLLQDPLRVLRAIRFAAQLSFDLNPRLFKTACDKRLHQALQHKVSRDRIGRELDAIFQTRDPTRGVQLLFNAKLLETVFYLNSNNQVFATNNMSPQQLQSVLPSLEEGVQVLSQTQALASRIFIKPSEWDEDRRRFLWYAALFQPAYSKEWNIHDNVDRSETKQGKRKSQSVVYQLMTSRLKRPASDTQAIERILAGSNKVGFVLEELLKVEVKPNDTKQQTTTVADLRWLCYQILKPIGPFWKESILLALLEAEGAAVAETISHQAKLHKTERKFRTLISVLLDSDGLGLKQFLDDGTSSFSFKPIMNGSDIQRILPSVSGEGFRQVMNAQEEWQLRNNCCFTNNNEDKKYEKERLIKFLCQSFPDYMRKHSTII